MIVCIAGMHRSGTSLVARVLNQCGLHLGSPTDMLPPAPDNPHGYWEHVRFVELNAHILSQLGGGWDLPPRMTPGWPVLPQLAAARRQAKELAALFDGVPCWGWKDPRNALTLPFWQTVLPPMKVIICLRHPWEVHHSLEKRAYSSSAFSFHLWWIYNHRVLQALDRQAFFITHYPDWFTDPQVELQRLLNFLNMTCPEHIQTGALATIDSSLYHHRFPDKELATKSIPSRVGQLYRKMLALADQHGSWSTVEMDKTMAC